MILLGEILAHVSSLCVAYNTPIETQACSYFGEHMSTTEFVLNLGSSVSVREEAATALEDVIMTFEQLVRVCCENVRERERGGSKNTETHFL